MIDNLPKEVLLDIFDCYRQYFKYGLNYDEKAWNGIDGWFRLAHVCPKWRYVVLASPARLDLKLFITAKTPIKMAIAKGLPFLPIFINYTTGNWTTRDRERVLVALKYSGRVQGIALRGQNNDMGRVLKAMNRKFPALEILELINTGVLDLNLTSTFLWGSAPQLRRLELCGVPSTFLAKLLSSTTSLLDLSLRKIDLGPSRTALLLTHLQDMPCLCRLELQLERVSRNDAISPRTKGKDNVTLANLTYFHFSGPGASLEVLLAGLSAPSLQDFHIALHDTTPTFLLPHVPRFICDVEEVSVALIFFSIRSFRISMHNNYRPYDHSPFEILIPRNRDSITELGDALSTKFATVEDLLLLLTWYPVPGQGWLFEEPILWHGFFRQFSGAKILRVQRELVLEIAYFLRSDDRGPILDTLPALEKIELLSVGLTREYSMESLCTSALDIFKPFVAARQRAGRPVDVFWNMDYLKSLPLPKSGW
ncbi:hypothetical protein B0F90DRAFT_1713043 [Multifurca ochricompacta]|uniref:F-box domain-containing protein n=1 Tax=Multifurca ochricompacta TaxID=376703 RepID=A0AAD4M6Z5_9AGAM|nr:hypothetical protein B0F90DRAFT_1713043 [Multifurca ochricompacta]